MDRQHEFRIELFVFPDGTSVEMMVFDGAGDAAPIGEHHVRERAPEPQAPPAPAADPRQARPALHVSGAEARACPLCGSELVYPTDWVRRGDNTWRLRLRCPNCETRRDVVLDRRGVEDLNRELYRAHQAVAEESRTIARRNFEEEAARIVAALASGLLQPMDF
jgi:hypothetical protein